MAICLQMQERELIELTLEDLRHIAKETGPECDDHQLRRVSVQLRHLLIEDAYVRSWKLLQLQPKSPMVVAPRLRADGLQQDDLAVAGGGQIGGLSIGNAKFMPGRALSDKEVKELFEREKNDMEYNFSLSEFKDSCAVYAKGRKITRKQLIQYIANKKGGAHLDHKRKQDEEAYATSDAVLAEPMLFGGQPAQPVQKNLPGKNPVYLELLSIGQFLTRSSDTKRFMEVAESVL
ncbi:MAG: hypothetical protein GC182_06710 [Rhodopseudomonas sp.]|nr:hypothetical protein [Rhodopseudomonas sp.]